MPKDRRPSACGSATVVRRTAGRSLRWSVEKTHGHTAQPDDRDFQIARLEHYPPFAMKPGIPVATTELSRLSGIIFPGNIAQMNHILHQQVEPACPKVPKIFGRTSSAAMSAVVVAINSHANMH